ncbi:hypothetical protein DXG01_001669 [Tephrocybe rancida]|nr:hypothetical protein DXG01_001669 [Tephrocybe rancida]
MPSFRTLLAFVVTAFAVACSAAPVASNPVDATTSGKTSKQDGSLDPTLLEILATTVIDDPVDLLDNDVLGLTGRASNLKRDESGDALGNVLVDILSSTDEVIGGALGSTRSASKRDESGDVLGIAIDDLLSNVGQVVDDLLGSDVDAFKRDEIADVLGDVIASSDEVLADVLGSTLNASKRDEVGDVLGIVIDDLISNVGVIVDDIL